MYEIFKLRKKRSVSDSVSDVFNYLKIHIWNLLKLMLVLVGPFYIVGGIFIGQFYGNMFSMIETTVEPDLSTMIMLIPSFILLMIGSIVYQATTVSYMKFSLTLPKEEITLSLVFNDLKQYFWKYVGAQFLLMLGFTIPIAIVAGVLALITPFLSVLSVFIGLIYLFISISIYPFAIGVEDVSAFDSFKRSFFLIKGNWWRSFGYYILLYFVQSFISAIVIVPFYILVFFRMFSQAITNPNSPPDVSYMGGVMTFGMPIVLFLSMFLYCFYSIGMGINYFTLVEIKEEVGLGEEIEAMNANENALS